jgi:hypothetical protein
VAFNSGHEVRTCDLPAGFVWHQIIDTELPSPEDVCEDEASAAKITSTGYEMQPYSCIVLKTYQTFQEVQFLVDCDCTSPGEVLFIVGSEVALGSWDPAKAIRCSTNAEEFPMWKSPILAVPCTSTAQFEFKLVKKNEADGCVIWEEGENHQVVMPSMLVVQERVTLGCAWEQQEIDVDRPQKAPESAPLSNAEKIMESPLSNIEKMNQDVDYGQSEHFQSTGHSQWHVPELDTSNIEKMNQSEHFQSTGHSQWHVPELDTSNIEKMMGG